MTHILIAEDDKFLSKIYSSKLQGEGFQLTTVGNGQEALDAAKSQKPNLILLDLIMPVMSGFDCLKALKEDENLQDIPVLVLSNLGQEADVSKCMELGAADFIVKANVSIQEVVDKINMFVK